MVAPQNPYGPPPGPPPGAPPPGAPPHTPPAAKPFDPKMTAYILGGCALAILIGVFTKSWMTGRGGLSGVGPLGIEVCFGGVCQSNGWTGAPASVSLPGYLALLSGIAAAGACGWMAFLTLSNAPNKFPAFKIINGALGFGAAGTTFFLVRLLIEGQELSISWSPVFGIGGVIAGGIFVRKLRPYWPGEGNMPWPVAVAARPMGQLPPGQPYGQPPYGAPQQPFGAPPQQGFGAPMGAPPSGPPMGGAPMGAPPSGPPMGAQPYGAPMGAPPSGPPMGGAPMGAPPSGPPIGTPMNASAAPRPPQSPMVMNNPPAPGGPYGAPMGGPPNAPIGTTPNLPPPASPMSAPMGGPPKGGPPIGTAPTMAAPGAPQNKATILGAPAPQLAAILKQQQPAGAQPTGAAGAQPAGAQPTSAAGAGAAAQAQFCPRCGKPMTFVAQYQRWFCQGCQQYA